MDTEPETDNLFAWSYQPEPVSHSAVFFSYSKSASARISQSETIQQTCCSLEIESKKHHAQPNWMSTSCLDIIHGPSRAWVCLSPELALTAVVSPTTVISHHERDLQRFAQGYKDGAWSHTPIRLSFLSAWWESTSPGFGGPGSRSRFTMFAYAEIWLMLKYCEKKYCSVAWK
jgi:hypothetical protein